MRILHCPKKFFPEFQGVTIPMMLKHIFTAPKWDNLINIMPVLDIRVALDVAISIPTGA